MKLIKKITFEIKKSKFIGYYYNINSIDEVDTILQEVKKENKKARHFPYAYKIDNQIKKSDDKEPTNTAGGPILNIIEKKELNNVLIIIPRYFGGIRLGAGGLIRAYGKTANIVTEKNWNISVFYLI